METLAIIGLVGNIVQLIDFSSKVISKSTELYRSSEGALAENIDTETATNHLILLNNKLRNAATATGDGTLKSLCQSCNTAAEKLLATLNEVKVEDKQQKWKSIRKALRSVLNKEELGELEQRLARFRAELNLHIVVDLREQVSQFKSEQSGRFKGLDLTTQKIIDAIIQQQDVFEAAHDTQIALMGAIHRDTISMIQDEHAVTRREIRDLRQPKQNMNFAEQQQCLAKLPHAAQAAFNSSDNQHDPLCLKDTRVDVLDQIRAWADGSDERCIFWLNGMAGTGKSTIARTIAREYCNKKRLGASFFFSRGTEDRSHAGKFFTTIAMQLAHISSTLKGHICTAIAEHSDIANQSLLDQWKRLILQPLSMWMATSCQSPLFLVIDALDECDGDKDIQEILQLFAEAKSLKPVHLRIFVTSRPETPIRLGFRKPGILHQDLALHQVSPTIVNNDILIFFEHALEEIRNTSDDLPVGWPGKEAVSILVLKAHSLFIYAATVCRFIEQGGEQWPPEDLLRLILLDETTGDSSPGNAKNMTITDESPTKGLDKMYTQILKHSFKGVSSTKDRQQIALIFRQVVGAIVILFNPLSAISIARLLDIDGKKIQMRLRHLHSVLEVPDSQTHPLRLFHPSFRDFLLDKERCSDQQLWVDEKKTHAALADACIRLMSNKLRRDICGLHAPDTLAADVRSDQIEQCLPAELQYACRYWVQHLQRSDTLRLDDGQVHKFLQQHLLHWLEALSLIQKTSESTLTISSLESMIKASESPRLHTFVYDAKRFILHNRSIIEEAPLQIYCSALIFTPEMSVVRRQFQDQIPYWFSRLAKVQRDWSSLEQTLEGHSGSVMSVVFSPDGSKLVSASDDRTVRVWNIGTGQVEQTLEGHWDPVTSVAFSPDGSKLASASDDRTVRVWNISTGQVEQTLKGHLDSVTSVVFSPDGSKLASASDDRTVRVWNIGTGQVEQTLEGHSGRVTSVAFSPDGSKLASASYEGTVLVWNIGTGQVERTLVGHSDLVKSVAFSPDGSKLASASYDRTVRVWNIGTGQVERPLEGHWNSVTSSDWFTIVAPPSFYSVDTSRRWVTRNGSRILYLPLDNRPGAVATEGSTLAIGAVTGRVTIIIFR